MSRLGWIQPPKILVAYEKLEHCLMFLDDFHHRFPSGFTASMLGTKGCVVEKHSFF